MSEKQCKAYLVNLMNHCQTFISPSWCIIQCLVKEKRILCFCKIHIFEDRLIYESRVATGE